MHGALGRPRPGHRRGGPVGQPVAISAPVGRIVAGVGDPVVFLLPLALGGPVRVVLGGGRRRVRLGGPALGVVGCLVGPLVGLRHLRLGRGHPLAVVADVALGAVALLLGEPLAFQPDVAQGIARLQVVGRDRQHLLVGLPRLSGQAAGSRPVAEVAPSVRVAGGDLRRARVVLVEGRLALDDALHVLGGDGDHPATHIDGDGLRRLLHDAARDGPRALEEDLVRQEEGGREDQEKERSFHAPDSTPWRAARPGLPFRARARSRRAAWRDAPRAPRSTRPGCRPPSRARGDTSDPWPGPWRSPPG